MLGAVIISHLIETCRVNRGKTLRVIDNIVGPYFYIFSSIDGTILEQQKIRAIRTIRTTRAGTASTAPSTGFRVFVSLPPNGITISGG
jgi:hypothetical protein